MTLDCFKETEIGPIPVGWEVVRLGDVFEIKQGKALSRKKDSGISPHRFLRTANVLWGRIDLSTIDEMDFTEKEVEKFALEPGDLLVCEGGEIGRTAIWQLESGIYCYQNHLHRLRPIQQNVEPLFYMYWMQAALLILNLYQGVANVTTIANLSRSRLSQFVLPKPPFPEQRRIAHVLSTIQRAIAVQEGLIAAAREVKRSLMQRLFTYGPGPDPAPTKETEIGDIPEHWEVTQLGKVVEKPQYGYTASASEEPIGPNFLRITDIQDNRVQWGSVPYCEIDNRRLEKYRLKQGDILIARIGATTGKTYLITECPDSVFASYLIRVRAKPESVTSEYLHYFTNTEIYWTQINASKGGRLKQGVNIPVLTSLVVPLPPLSEQRAIARILNAMDCKIEAEQQRKATLEALFKSTLQQLMTGQIRV